MKMEKVYKTEQEVFDVVYDWFVIQGKPRSYNPEDDYLCMYRGPNGAKCGAGILIPDSLYQKEMEGRNIWDIYGYEGISNLFNNNRGLVSFVQKIQEIHDDYDASDAFNSIDFTQYMKNELEEIADFYNLRIPNQ